MKEMQRYRGFIWMVATSTISRPMTSKDSKKLLLKLAGMKETRSKKSVTKADYGDFFNDLDYKIVIISLQVLWEVINCSNHCDNSVPTDMVFPSSSILYCHLPCLKISVSSVLSSIFNYLTK